MWGAVSAGVPSFGDLAWKSPVRAVQVGAFPSQSTTAQTVYRSSNGVLPSVDGVALSVGDRLLLAQQSPGYVEGIYVVTSLGSAGSPWVLTRSRDCDTAAEMVVGATVLVTEGDTWAGVQAVAGASWTPTSGDADWQPNPQLVVSQSVFTVDDTWTRPSAIGTYRVVVIGGGGGGGGTLATSGGQGASGSGGGAGGTAIRTFQGQELAATESVTIGDGGAGVSGDIGDDGESSFFAPAKAYALEGGGGIGGNAGTNTSGSTRTLGGSGGEAFGGDMNLTGGDGGNGGTLAGQYVPIGDGGASYVAGAVHAAVAASGIPASGKGGGGSGATASASTGARAGGDGGSGLVIVEEFYIGRGTWS